MENNIVNDSALEKVVGSGASDSSPKYRVGDFLVMIGVPTRGVCITDVGPDDPAGAGYRTYTVSAQQYKMTGGSSRPTSQETVASTWQWVHLEYETLMEMFIDENFVRA